MTNETNITDCLHLHVVFFYKILMNLNAFKICFYKKTIWVELFYEWLYFLVIIGITHCTMIVINTTVAWRCNGYVNGKKWWFYFQIYQITKNNIKKRSSLFYNLIYYFAYLKCRYYEVKPYWHSKRGYV